MDSSSSVSDRPEAQRRMTAPALPSAPLRRSTTSSTTSTSQGAAATAAADDDDLVETLYDHPSVRIISFTSSRHDFTTSFAKRSDNDAPPGSLPPSSRLERTIAAGAFRIYRAPGSVAFLSCGSALQPILPKSQCWCIDEDNGRFVLQIRRPQYWRIELPVDHPDDALRALLLRDVFDKILLFEKTECPFERSFTVELPDPPETPIKKKAWTAEGKNLISSPFQFDLSPPAHAPKAISRGDRAASISYEFSPTDDGVLDGRHFVGGDQPFGSGISDIEVQWGADGRVNVGPLRHHMLSREDNNHPLGVLRHIVTRPSTWSADIAQDPTATLVPSSLATNAGVSRRLAAQTSDSSSEAMDVLHEETHPRLAETSYSGEDDNWASFEGSGHVAPVNLARKRMTRMLAGRSYAASPSLTTMASTPSESNEQAAAKKVSPSQPPSLARGRSTSACTESFRGVQSWHSPVTSSPALPRAGGVSSEPEGTELPALMSQQAYSSGHTSAPKNAINFVPSSSDRCNSAESAPQPIMDKEFEETVDSESESRVSRLSTFDGRVRAHRRSHASSLSISRQALSPLPPAANLFASAPRQTPQSRLAASRWLPAAIVRKTVEILLSPPNYLIKLMLHVAAKIAAGEWRGLVLGFSEAGEEIPVQWDYYSDGEFSDLSDSDDYTLTNHNSNYNGNIPHTNVRRRSRWGHNQNDDSCEVD